MRNFKVKDDYVQELIDKQVKKETKINATALTIQSFKENNKDIWSLKYVKDAVETEHGLVASKKFVANIMRNNLDMRFHKVKRVAFKGNSERSLVVR